MTMMIGRVLGDDLFVWCPLFGNKFWACTLCFEVGHVNPWRSQSHRWQLLVNILAYKDLARRDNILQQQNYEGIHQMPSFFIVLHGLSWSISKEHINLNAPKPGLPETKASDPNKFLPWHLCGDSSPSHGTVWPASETTCDAAQATSSGLMTWHQTPV